MVILLAFLRARRADLLLSRKSAMMTSTALYWARTRMALGILLAFLGLEGQTATSLEDLPG